MDVECLYWFDYLAFQEHMFTVDNRNIMKAPRSQAKADTRSIYMYIHYRPRMFIAFVPINSILKCSTICKHNLRIFRNLLSRLIMKHLDCKISDKNTQWILNISTSFLSKEMVINFRNWGLSHVWGKTWEETLKVELLEYNYPITFENCFFNRRLDWFRSHQAVSLVHSLNVCEIR